MTINWEVIIWTCITLAVLMSIIGLILYAISAKNVRSKRKELGEVHTELKVGSRIMFAGGVYGKVVGIDDEDTLRVEVAPKVVITISRYAVQTQQDVLHIGTDLDLDGIVGQLLDALAVVVVDDGDLVALALVCHLLDQIQLIAAAVLIVAQISDGQGVIVNDGLGTVTEAQLGIVHGSDLAGSQLQSLQCGLLCNALQANVAQINDTVVIELVHDLLCQTELVIEEVLTGHGQLLHLSGDLVQLVEVEGQIGSQIHIAVAGSHGEGLVVGLGGQVDGEAVVTGVCQLGQSTLVVAGHEQVIQVLADDLSGLHIAQRLGGVARTAKVHQQGGLGAGEEVLGGRHEVGRSVGLDLEIVLGVQGLEQGVADELAGAGTGEDDVEIILFAQTIALMKSLSLGITPDNPCPTGEVNRVVKGVTLYPYTLK